MIDLTGRHIFICGGSRGIGAESARLAAKAGADLSINYHERASAAEQVAADVTRMGRRAWTVKADAAADGSLDAAIDESVRRLGPLRGLVVSAGIFESSKLETMSADFWDRTMAINLRATFLAVRAAARTMRHAKAGGSIVIYTSTAGQRGSADFSAYATSKGAQIIFMRSMALELAKDRIRVNCIAPSWTETEMSGATMDAIGREQVLNGCPLGRVGLPQDVAGATCFLLSDLANFITGTTMTVDGGIDMRG
ncbi:MAG: SDR family oxidoreductase [Planctomycetes bacterium]|nr:SDR family oxidoreductase [Planctomycetota bacterium]